MLKKTKISQIKSIIHDMIEQKEACPGDRLPSLRDLHRKTGISLNCVTRAYHDLVREGIIESRQGSGYFVVGPSTIPPRSTETLTMPWMEKAHLKTSSLYLGGSPLAHDAAFDMQMGLVPPLMQPRTLLAKCLREISREFLTSSTISYNGPEIDQIRSIIWSQYRIRNLEIHHPWIIPNLSRHQALHLTVESTCRDNPVVAIQSPLSFVYHNILQTLGMNVIECHDSAQGVLDPEVLEEIFITSKPSLLVVQPHVSNPTGVSWPESVRRAVIDLCRIHEVHIYEIDDLAPFFNNGRHPPLMALAPETVSLYSGLNHTVGEFAQFGWLISEAHYPKLIKRRHYAFGEGYPLNLQIAIKMLSSRGFDEHLNNLRKQSHKSIKSMTKTLRHYVGDKLEFRKPDGGYYLWVRVPNSGSTLELLKKTAAQGILFNSGEFFSPEGRYCEWMRLNCLTSEHPLFKQAIVGFCGIVDAHLNNS